MILSEDHFFLPPIADGEDKTSPLANCIRNNYRHIRKWAKKSRTNCFRLYDREIHQFPLAIDFYDGRFCVHYFSKSLDTAEPPQELIHELAKALHIALGAHPDAIFWRTRAKTKTTRQYEKIAATKQFFTVLEYDVAFKVNLTDYLDTGLFLDHRETRQWVAKMSKGKRVLNLFAYTCAFSVHAAVAGALYTKSVDMSHTYLDWGKENFELNALPLENHAWVRADCLKFLDEEIRSRAQYDLIVLDPPTISRSKKMAQLFDIHVDYVFLIQKALALLAQGGVILFSTNSRKFELDVSRFASCRVEEITHKTIPMDFINKKIHRCWKIGQVL